jgi:metal-sulfur cluster biosynthetic enzyme
MPFERYNTRMKDLEEKVWQALKKVIDPELHIDVVSLGLIYGVSARLIEGKTGPTPFIHVLMTLTTPGCPLAGMFDTMIKDALKSIEGIDVHRNVVTELTFDPPWIPDMMTEESKAELGL